MAVENVDEIGGGSTNDAGAGNDSASSPAGTVIGSPSAAPSAGPSTASPRAAPTGPLGGHAACACYEAPYASAEIDCSGSSQKLASWSADNIVSVRRTAPCRRRWSARRVSPRWTKRHSGVRASSGGSGAV